MAGRVVEVDGVGVGETDHHPAQRVVGPGGLAQQDPPRIAPVDSGWVEYLTLIVQHLHVVLREVVQVVADLRQLILAQDGRRHRPGRVEGEARDGRLDGRRLPGIAADLDARFPLRAAVAKVDHPSAGDIDQQRARLDVGR